MDITSANLAALRIRFDKIFQSAFSERTIFWQKVAQLLPSVTDVESHVWMDRLPQLRKWHGDRVVQNASLRSQEVKNEPFELTIGLDKHRVEDNRIQAFDGVVREIAEQAKKWPDALLFAPISAETPGVLANGQNAIVYDGEPFFATAHPQNPDIPGSPTMQNYWASGMALTAANYAAVRAAMMGYKGADGYALGVVPRLLIVPPALEETGRQILHAEFIAPAAAFGQNAAAAPQTNTLKGSADLLVVPDLAGQDAVWYLADVSHAIKPFIFQQRQAPQFVSRTRPDDPPVFERHEFQYGVDARGAGAYGPWFYCAKASA